MTNLFVVFTARSKMKEEIGNAILEDTSAPKGGKDIIKIQREIKRRVDERYGSIERIILMDWKEM